MTVSNRVKEVYYHSAHYTSNFKTSSRRGIELTQICHRKKVLGSTVYTVTNEFLSSSPTPQIIPNIK